MDNLQGCSGLVRPGQLAGFIIHRIQIFVILSKNFLQEIIFLLYEKQKLYSFNTSVSAC